MGVLTDIKPFIAIRIIKDGNVHKVYCGDKFLGFYTEESTPSEIEKVMQDAVDFTADKTCDIYLENVLKTIPDITNIINKELENINNAISL